MADYRLHFSTFPGRDSTDGNYSTKKVAVGLVDPFFYRAEFKDPTWFVLKKMSVQLLLALLLVALITLSFIFLYRNLAAQQKLTAIKNEFIGNITHELKTPIATVSVAIEAMRNFNALQNPERAKEYLEIAGQELNRLSLLVDKVLRLSMFENKQLELKVSTFDFLQLLNEVIKSMQLQFEKSNAIVNVEVKGEDFSIQADHMHITSVIYNLLDNAIKYSTDPVIQVTATATTGQVILTIKDNGIGIDPVYKDKIFEKFFRVPQGHQHNVKGYGLGLSYASHIISQHRGSIVAESDGKSGTTFTIKLPKTNAG
jgi:signal transduction histidine kinase